MGLDANGAEFLFYAKSQGVDFAETLTIGRQRVYISPQEMAGVLRAFGREASQSSIQCLCAGQDGYAEPLFEYLGANKAHALDFSDYEKPTVTHDMNEPLPEHLKSQYTVVLDGGSLEHVFNFPVAIKNCMELVKVGGHYLAITPANNFLGHGFYQFSPELYFNVLSPKNGYELQHMIAFEDIDSPQWYRVANPAVIGGRVTLCNQRPVYLLIIAKRIAQQPIFATTPQQSDYTVIWGNAPKPILEPAPVPTQPRPLPIRLAKLVLPQNLRFLLRRIFTPPKPAKPVFGFDKKFFEPLSHRGS